MIMFRKRHRWVKRGIDEHLRCNATQVVMIKDEFGIHETRIVCTWSAGHSGHHFAYNLDGRPFVFPNEYP